MGIERELVIYSGRNRPDLTPVYLLFERLFGIKTKVEKVYHHDIEPRILEERADPRADLLLTNSQLAVELARGSGIFEPYASPVAKAYPAWLRAPDFAWLSFTAWPRAAMVNRAVLPESAAWPVRLEDLTDSRFRNAVACAALVETTTVAQFAALRVVKGDGYTTRLLDALLENGMRIYASNLRTREALARERKAVAIANSSNIHVFYMEGNPVGEAWLDQEGSGTGTHVEAHTVAVLAGTKHPAEARAFVDFLLSAEIQTLLARLFGETPVNADAAHGPVRPLAEIKRMNAPLAKVAPLMESTVTLLRDRGFDVRDDSG
ncbi:MAG TPA: extracellular solute-binding protein [Candidatus Limnocylindria bacterium]|jgi:iron(III) transport system substrate-binding protein|nr:extracellular solute-binding protein [Candidatus Limnocylindria bacterium]